jgi:hypothetical protein
MIMVLIVIAARFAVPPIPVSLLLILVQLAVIAILVVVVVSIPAAVVSIFIGSPPVIITVVGVVGAIVASVFGAADTHCRNSERRQQENRGQVLFRTGHAFSPSNVVEI